MASSRSIDCTERRGLKALGMNGQPIIELHQQIRAYLRNRLGARHAALLAEPVQSEDGLRIDWHCEVEGRVQSWRDASPEERRAIELSVEELTRDVRALASELEGAQDARLRDQARLLRAAASTPGRESYFVVGDQPVLSAWAFERDSAAAPPSELSGRAASPRERPEPPPLLVSEAPVAAAPARRSRVWLLALPLLALFALAVCAYWPSWKLAPVLPDVTAQQPAEIPDPRAALRKELDTLRAQYALRREQCVPPAPLPEEPAPPPPPEPEVVEAPPPPEPPPPVKPPPVQAARCDQLVPPGKQARIVFAMDGSRSMAFPVSWGVEDDRRFEEELNSMPGPLALARMYQVTNQPGPKRLERAIDAVRRLVPLMPASVSLGLVEFGVPDGPGPFSRGCQAVSRGIFGAGQRAEFERQVRSILPDASTPIGLGMIEAGRLLAGGPPDEPAILVLVTDGMESCDGDPCGTARALKQRIPTLKIPVIDLVGYPDLRCIADATGDKVYQPSASQNLAEVVREATVGALRPPECR